MGKLAMVLSLSAGLAAASTARADEVLFSFGYTDLNGTYDTASQTFTAADVDIGTLRSAGDVTRLVPGGGTAHFLTGFASGGTDAAFSMSMRLTNITPGMSAQVDPGDGEFMLTDIDGDTISGRIHGTWTTVGFGFLFFSGLLDEVILTDNGDRDNLFDGNDGGSLSMDFSNFVPEGPLMGPVITLLIQPGNGFFDRNFTMASTQVSGEIIPAPAALTLLGLGGILAGRRRKA